jgi:SOS-response transcriptional repressor LexA
MEMAPAQHPGNPETLSFSRAYSSTTAVNGNHHYGSGELFAMDVCTSIMQGAGISEGDTLVVDRQKEARNESIVIAELAGELLVRQLKIGQGKKWLVAPGAGVSVIEISGGEIWGVVDHLLRKMP